MSKKKSIKLPELKCLRCGHTWNPRTNKEPEVCPGCNSPYWNRERVRPKRASVTELTKVRVTISDETALVLVCDTCGQSWSPNLQSGGRMPKGYWQCPKGCNHDLIPIKIGHFKNGGGIDLDDGAIISHASEGEPKEGDEVVAVRKYSMRAVNLSDVLTEQEKEELDNCG